MLATRWQPFTNTLNPLWWFRNEMDRLVNEYENGLRSTGVSFPQLCIWEEGENLFAEAELPGMSLEDLEIYVTAGNQLTIKGERRQPDYGKGTWHRQERGFGRFSRTITLPLDVNADRIEATLAQGVLTIQMPKSEAARPRKIQVKAC